MAGVALVAFLAAALGIGVSATPNEPVAVDEPQYLMTAQSLWADGDLDISNQIAARSWREFTPVEPPIETVTQPDGRQISPHDPLLPIVLAVPVGLAGWVGAKLTMAVLAGALAALTLWVAVRRFAVPTALAATGTGIAAASAPLAVYGQQIYPELPAALVCLLGVSAITGRRSPASLALLACTVLALPWLSVKYAPVAVALAVAGALRIGARRELAWFVGILAAGAAVYALIHVAVWGGLTVYASGDHFAQTGQLGVMGEDPNFVFRSWRLIDLLVDRTFGLAAWQPGWLLLVPALGALAAKGLGMPWGRTTLALPLAAGWLVATYPALTMHGYWWPGRQVVVVLPLAALIILCWLARAGRIVRAAAAVLGAAGVFTYGCLLVDGHTGEVTWVNGFQQADAPVFHALHPLLAYYGTTTSNVVWAGMIIALLAAGFWQARRARSVLDDVVAEPLPSGRP
ncbi:hypothetical protein [Mycobacterium hubeiense]|uniref:hypothetical protein n=1 Tax=Mycobacterium hubeiense TaxID=1867256 RepID=UPI000C7F289D|nr:hypothetical protein [Mycobacterium sp. QGD 101]